MVGNFWIKKYRGVGQPSFENLIHFVNYCFMWVPTETASIPQSIEEHQVIWEREILIAKIE